MNSETTLAHNPATLVKGGRKFLGRLSRIKKAVALLVCSSIKRMHHRQYFQSPDTMRQSIVVLLVACTVLAYQLHLSDAQFSFSLPGKWGNGKRSFSFSLPGKWGSGKRGSDFGGGDCGSMSPQTLFQVLTLIEAEAQKVSECLAKAELQQRTDVGH